MLPAALARSSSDGTLRTSGFVYDVKFLYNRFYGGFCEFVSDESAIAETTASIGTKFCSSIKISKYTLCVAHRGRSLLSAIALLFLLSVVNSGIAALGLVLRRAKLQASDLLI